MLFASPVLAQKKTALSLQWEMANHLPADSGQTISLGVAGPVTGFCQNRLIVAGGANFPNGMPWEGGAKKYHDRIFVYSQNRHKLVLTGTSGKLPEAIAYAANCTLPEGLLYAGGENEKGVTDKVWLIRIDKKGQLSFITLPSLPVAVSNASIAVLDKIVYLAGGENNVQSFSQLLSLNLNNTDAGWKKLADIPQPVSHAVFTAGKNDVSPSLFLSGGRRKNKDGISTIYNNLWVYDIHSDQWKEKAALPYALCAGTGIQQDEHTILLFGGDKGIVFNKAETLISAISKETDPERKKALTAEKNTLQANHPGFSQEILRYDCEKNEWTSMGQLPYNTPVTTTAVKGKYGILIPSGEIKAGVRTPGILSLKIRYKQP